MMAGMRQGSSERPRARQPSMKGLPVPSKQGLDMAGLSITSGPQLSFLRQPAARSSSYSYETRLQQCFNPWISSPWIIMHSYHWKDCVMVCCRLGGQGEGASASSLVAAWPVNIKQAGRSDWNCDDTCREGCMSYIQ